MVSIIAVLKVIKHSLINIHIWSFCDSGGHLLFFLLNISSFRECRSLFACNLDEAVDHSVFTAIFPHLEISR